MKNKIVGILLIFIFLAIGILIELNIINSNVYIILLSMVVFLMGIFFLHLARNESDSNIY